MRDLAALNDSHRAEPPASPASPASPPASPPASSSSAADSAQSAGRDLDRMLGACKVVLAWYCGVFEEKSECVPTPPLGTHIIRRRSILYTDDADDKH